MSRFLKRKLTLLVMICLAGCSGSGEAPTAAPSEAPVIPKDASKDPAEPQGSGLNKVSSVVDGLAWPPGVDAPFPTFVRGSDTTVNKLGQQRARTVAEYQEFGFADAVPALNDAMATAGFTSRKALDQPNGNTILRFDKPGYGSVNFTITPQVIGKPRHTSSVGMLILDAPADAGVVH